MINIGIKKQKKGFNVDRSFIDDFNEVSVRNTKKCRCKICDQIIINQKIIYMRSFRLQAQPFQICISCWKKLNILIEEELNKEGE